MDIHFIQAGGTMDKNYSPNPGNHGYNFAIGDPAFLRILKRAGYSSAVSYSVACKLDSLDMDDDSRRNVAIHVSQAPSPRIVITHGTDTILQTAEAIVSFAGTGKTVILTGAMQPELQRDSDADFNLGMAIAAAQILPPGVYIALGGKVVYWTDYVPT